MFKKKTNKQKRKKTGGDAGGWASQHKRFPQYEPCDIYLKPFGLHSSILMAALSDYCRVMRAKSVHSRE